MVLDTYQSVIWTERYNEFGDFEIYAPVTMAILDGIKIGYYLTSETMDSCMIVESISISSDVENGHYISIKGRSLESILDRRIVWNQTRLRMNLEESIKKLLEDAILIPDDNARRISNFEFRWSDDVYIQSIQIDKQFTGDNLYDAIVSLCQLYDIGFKIMLEEQSIFVFQLYKGQDRSYEQETNPYVVFSPNFENIINSSYSENVVDLKTITLVAGEEKDDIRTTAVVEKPGYINTGLERREMFTDARDISSRDEEAEPDEDGNIPSISPEEYNALLESRGLEYLYENNSDNSFEGQVDSKHIFVYNRDFFKGDIVQIVGFTGNLIQARIVEVIYSQDETGEDLYPTFQLLE